MHFEVVLIFDISCFVPVYPYKKIARDYCVCLITEKVIRYVIYKYVQCLRSLSSKQRRVLAA